ncbi:TonB-dependent receptor [Synechococcales cyanobacterium C]|uniref:TonB-dependent receptor n=1 Tax=Petrachloros mirabilis ULC683 TaxID=2781853 RepID=A0A8K2A098_9CYAN|nr:TonB-dependent receptor [Petrachloros mirabilis]NCJ08610.1 TonB-dependent receptor [Petrachloros mirabilis ULC683]
MMGQLQQLMLMAKALMLGTASFVSLGLGLGWATPALGNEDALDGEGLALDQVEYPATTVAEWMAQIEASQVQITGVRLEPTETGLSIVLETPNGDLPTPTTQTVGNALIAEIPNAVLALPEGDAFEQFDPAEGIALVSVTGLPGERVRVSVTGTDAPPEAQVRAEAQGLVFGVTPGTETASVQDEDAIQVVVTATRREEPLENIPRSVTVITRETLEQQSTLSRDLPDILGREVPGFEEPRQNRVSGFRLRGRGVSVLIDGVPASFNTQTRPLQTIAPDAIERIEVVRGPNAIYGAEATGGVINIITRRPTEEGLNHNIEVGVSAAGSGDGTTLPADGFGNYLQYGFLGFEDPFDFTFSLSRESLGDFFDGEGDRIFNFRPLAQSDTLNIFSKIGVDLSSQQRLQLTFNYYDSNQTDNEFVEDLSVDESPPGTEKPRGIRVGRLEFIDTTPPRDRTTLFNLAYTHENLLSSRFDAQAYYQDNTLSNPPIDGRGFGGTLNVSRTEHEIWGGRFQFDTPLSRDIDVLWGVDYQNEENSQIFDLLDPVAFDETRGQVNQRIDEAFNVPPYQVNQLGLFAQLGWEISDQLLLSGGVRHQRIGLNVDDYTTIQGNPIQGGEQNFSDTVFNFGTIYNITEDVSLFASFSQGFSVPDFGTVLRNPPAGFAVEADFVDLRPQKIDNYELGVRGNWNNVQASLAAFYNFSDLGSIEVVGESGFTLSVARAPVRIYGVEGTLDWQPGGGWQLGGTASWQEGETDFDGSGEFLPLDGATISPLKLTAYVEHQTTPGWRNRLQVLFVGSRDRAFNAEVDPIGIESYAVVDYISNIGLGPGTLSIGIENLFDNQYFPGQSQLFGAFSNRFRFPNRGRTFSVNYRITW